MNHRRLALSIAFSLTVTCSPLSAQDKSAESVADISLLCDGAFTGTFKVQSSGKIVGDGMAYTEIPAVAQFRIEAGIAQLNLPQPPTCSICVGEKGWRKVKKLKVSADRIGGSITYGAFSSTTFEIDRRTGIMTSRNGFNGNCKAQDLMLRKF